MERIELFCAILTSGASAKQIAKALNDAAFAVDVYGWGEVTPDGWYQDWSNEYNSLDGVDLLPTPTDMLNESRNDFHYTSPFTKEVVKNLIANQERIMFLDGCCYEKPFQS